ncbi:ABC transporter ATP-binding protein [Vallitalea sp.]|uniref:ABC transporter ATP-binding protein n=1 Tax=Vallitalea sp. TaxID=1882829 RepID=UPI0025EC917E|nr:ABC transporter ATP-binding protein [Vallitalea sp.]MCT4686731.1 ABC transporter ATP-binding protein/permease [Vallitalea sp.]
MNTYSSKERIKAVVTFIRPFKLQFVAILLCIIITCSIEMLFPYTYSILIDKLFYEKDINFIGIILIIYLILYAAMSSISILTTFLKASMTSKYVFKIREKIFRKILRLKAEYLDNVNFGDLITIINKDADSFLELVYSNIFYVIGNVIRFAVSFGFIYFINWKMGILLTLLLPFSIYSVKYVNIRAKKIYNENRKKYGLFISWLYEIIAGLGEIKILARDAYVKREYIKKWKELVYNKIEESKVRFINERISLFISLVGELSIYSLSAFLILHDQITVGGVIACVEYFGRAKFFFKVLSDAGINREYNIVAVNRILNILSEEDEWDWEKDKKSLIINEGNIEYRNVVFFYDNSNNIFDKINIHIKKGEKVALVGKSGAGKTTFTDLMIGLYENYQGEIIIDSQNIKDCSLQSIRKQIGIIRQKPLIFKQTLRENLLTGNKAITDEKIWETLKMVNADNFVNQLPSKLDTVIGEQGTKLSGGQIQRISIARVILKCPKIIIFDEATSSLDFDSDNMIKEVINKISNDITTISIAHRLSTIIDADKVIVLDSRKIVGVGTHSELLNKCHVYQKLFKEQYNYESV